MRLSKKYIPALLIFFITAALTILLSSTDAKKRDPFFKYNAGVPEDRFVQVMTGNSQDVPFLFDVGMNVPEVKLEISDSSLEKVGIVLEETTVQVQNGIAASQAIFGIQSKKAMRPGTYSLKIVARDSATGKVLRSGEIPFILDMEETIARCSC